jgi:hypothetical protein
MEEVNLKPSDASSDEERLAVGISTIGLKTNRLSGAQRKRLTRERKKREGTETKPPRKTPSISKEGGGGEQWGCEKTSLRLEHTILGKTVTKKPGTLKCRLGRIGKLLLVSRWRLFIDAILMSNWIRLRSS